MGALPDIVVEVAFDSGWATPAADRTWTNVTDYVEVAEGIGIGVGRADELSMADANTLALVLDNTDGRFTPGNASSPYYPNVKIGRPIRVSVDLDDVPENLLTDNQASVETDVSDWDSTGLSFAYTIASEEQSTTRAFEGTKSLRCIWPTTPTSSFGSHVGTLVTTTIGQTYTFSAYVWVPPGSPDVRVEAIPSSGSVVRGVRSSVKGAWTRLSVTFAATVTSYRCGVQVRTSVTGDECWVDAAMLNVGSEPGPFTMEPGARAYRFLGYLDSVPVAWDGGSDDYAKVSVTASSRIARLGVARTLRSIVEEEVLLSSPDAYYTLGEPEEATTAADSSGDGQQPLTQVGSGTAPVTFGTATGPGTDDLTAASFAGGKYLQGELSAPLGGTEQWARCSFNTSTTPGTDTYMVDTANATIDHGVALLVTTTGAVRALVGHSTGTLLLESASTFNDGETHDALIFATSGATVLYVDGEAVDTDATVVTLESDISIMSVGGQAGVTAGAFTGVIAHAAVGSTEVDATRAAAQADAALTGFEDDTPGDRITRYAELAAIPTDEIEVDTGTPPMAHIDTTGVTALEMMRKVEQTEGGVLFDAADGTLTFHHRARRYIAESALTVDVADHILEPDYSPQFDLQQLTNVATAKLGDETVTATAVNADSVDDYGSRSVEIELHTTDVNEPHAAAWWRVNTYGEPVPRVPTLSVNLLGLDADTVALILGLSVGSRITVTGLPSQAANATEDYFVEGYAESIALDRYVLTFNVSPASPTLTTWLLEDSTRGQLGTTTRLAY